MSFGTSSGSCGLEALAIASRLPPKPHDPRGVTRNPTHAEGVLLQSPGWSAVARPRSDTLGLGSKSAFSTLKGLYPSLWNPFTGLLKSPTEGGAALALGCGVEPLRGSATPTRARDVCIHEGFHPWLLTTPLWGCCSCGLDPVSKQSDSPRKTNQGTTADGAGATASVTRPAVSRCARVSRRAHRGRPKVSEAIGDLRSSHRRSSGDPRRARLIYVLRSDP